LATTGTTTDPSRTLSIWILGFDAEIARKGVPAPIQVGKRWVVERTNVWMNGYGKTRRCTDRDATIIDFYLYLAPRSSLSVNSSDEPELSTDGTPAPPPAA
jgi:hypothetical protein